MSRYTLQYGNIKDLNPYLIGGVRMLAKLCGVTLGDHPSATEIHNGLFPAWGNERAVAAALRLDGVIPSQQVMRELKLNGMLNAIPVRNYIEPKMPAGSASVIIRGASANRMVRIAQEAGRQIEYGLQPAGIYLVADGTRACDQDDEVNNPFVQTYHEQHGHYPTETELLPIIVKATMGVKRGIVDLDATSTTEQIKHLVVDRPALVQGSVYVPTVANATSESLEIRRTIRESWPSFDQDGSQFFFSQDGISLASTPEQAADAANYERPLAVFCELVRLVHELYLLQTRG